MGRVPRVDAPGDWHHVMNRGAGRRNVFRSDVERSAFVALISEFDDRFDLEVHAYCLMGNHYHLLLRSRSGRLSDAMSWMGSQFTRFANHQRNVDGAIFRGRFTSVRVHREPHLVWLFRYINANPLDLGWERPLSDYPWSGLSASLGAPGSPPWLRTDYVVSLFGRELRRLERFVEDARRAEFGGLRPAVGGVAEDDIAQALELARVRGPDVNTDAEARAAHTHLALAAGLFPHDVSTIGHLDPESAKRSVDRARRRCERPGSTQDLVGRAISILTIESEPLVPTTGA